MGLLKPTVKRDLALLSVEAWNRGYTVYLSQAFGFWYPAWFVFDGRKTNFYHRAEDFRTLKDVLTRRLIEDDAVFVPMLHDFHTTIARLKLRRRTFSIVHLRETVDLIGRAMALYMFVVSDAFVAARPEAWGARHASEGVLYELDAIMRKLVADRLIAAGYPGELAGLMTLREVEHMTCYGVVDARGISARQRGYVLHEGRLLTGVAFQDYCREMQLENSEYTVEIERMRMLQGKGSGSGVAQGRVRLVANLADAERLETGEVLVATMTNVNYLSAMARAAAIVTDEGGITCHAAIVARELKKPCVTGVKVATQVLHAGEEVRVDGERGSVLRLSA